MSESPEDAVQRVLGDVSRETMDGLHQFARLFTAWNRKINLISASSADQLWTRHIADSAQLVRLAPAAKHWLDIGSGGGFPGAIVAIILRDRPDAEIHLVESNRKKAAFLSRIVRETGAKATVHSCRVEDLHERDTEARLRSIDLVSARAVARLGHLIELAHPWLTTGAKALFQKGRDYRRELAECRVEWSFDLIEHSSRVDPGGVILELSDVRRRSHN